MTVALEMIVLTMNGITDDMGEFWVSQRSHTGALQSANNKIENKLLVLK